MTASTTLPPLKYEAKSPREMADFVLSILHNMGSMPESKSSAYVEHLFRLAALAAQLPSEPASPDVAALNPERANLVALHEGLKQARETLERDGVRHSWIDGYVNIAASLAAPKALTPDAEVAVTHVDARTLVRRYMHTFFAKQTLFPNEHLQAAYEAIDDLAASSHPVAGGAQGLTMADLEAAEAVAGIYEYMNRELLIAELNKRLPAPAPEHVKAEAVAWGWEELTRWDSDPRPVWRWTVSEYEPLGGDHMRNVQPLYTRPAPPLPTDADVAAAHSRPSDADVRDAGRWREAVRHIGGARDCDGIERFSIRGLLPLGETTIYRGSVAEHFTKAIDAAMAATPTAAQGNPEAGEA